MNSLDGQIFLAADLSSPLDDQNLPYYPVIWTLELYRIIGQLPCTRCGFKHDFHDWFN